MSRDSNSQELKIECSKRYPINSVVSCSSETRNTRVKYQWRYFKKKGVAIVLFWSFTVFLVFNYLINLNVEFPMNQHKRKYWYFTGMSGATMFFPMVGWIADVHVGRYTCIKFSMVIMWFSAILLFLAYALEPIYSCPALIIVFTVTLAIGVGGFQINGIQFCVDQLLDSSSTEIISYITWYVWSYFSSYLLIQYTQVFQHSKIVSDLWIPVLLTLAVSSDFLFNYLLVKEPVTQNPLKLIFNVLRYAVKNKYPRQRSVFTYWNDGYTRIDLAKTKYGGPFTTSQVEDVKMFFRILVLMIPGCIFIGTSLSADRIYMFIASQFHNESHSSHQLDQHYFWKLSVINFGYIFIVLFVPLYELCLFPLLKFLPTFKIKTRLAIGTLLILINIFSLTILELTVQVNTNKSNVNRTKNCLLSHTDVDKYDISEPIFYYWLIILSLIQVIGEYVVITGSIELICAQFPYSMKGLIFGNSYAGLGFTQLLVHFSTYYIFIKISVMGCIFWFLLTYSVLALLATVLGFLAYMCWYKDRERNEDDDIPGHSEDK